MDCRFSELRRRDVISISTGNRLGRVCDALVDLRTGQITALIVPGPASTFSLVPSTRLPGRGLTFCTTVFTQGQRSISSRAISSEQGKASCAVTTVTRASPVFLA